MSEKHQKYLVVLDTATQRRERKIQEQHKYAWLAAYSILFLIATYYVASRTNIGFAAAAVWGLAIPVAFQLITHLSIAALNKLGYQSVKLTHLLPFVIKRPFKDYFTLTNLVFLAIGWVFIFSWLSDLLKGELLWLLTLACLFISYLIFVMLQNYFFFRSIGS